MQGFSCFLYSFQAGVLFLSFSICQIGHSLDICNISGVVVKLYSEKRYLQGGTRRIVQLRYYCEPMAYQGRTVYFKYNGVEFETECSA